ncbi:phospholipid scramblase 1-like protein [Leptotrombidium deliense]|uniref:Phospholipid scramblase n=1 Tax=Leptotrombidium deliense TaxID=299467 RepID=A0A443S4E0_9ACAR|nr:phospholipid scramblase 1-like protein [Leptotrombidium deliense]
MSVITKQPQSLSTLGNWYIPQIKRDSRFHNCPPGMEPLLDANHLLIKQELELFEAFTGYETSNKYWITNSFGQNLFLAVEESECLTRQCAGSLRPFTIHIKDHANNTVAQVYRPMRCDTCCCPLCLQEIEVMAPPGITIGWVKQALTCCYPKFYVKDKKRKENKLVIKGPLWTCSCCYSDVEFDVHDSEGKQIGKITKHWSGFFKEVLTDADLFGIHFPELLDIDLKITLLGTVLLIDYMFFEDPACGKRKDCPGMCC